MHTTFKSTVQLALIAIFVVQLTGCFYGERNRRRHYDHPEHRDDRREPGIDIRVHG